LKVNLEDQVQARIEGHHPMSPYKPNNFCKGYFWIGDSPDEILVVVLK